MSATLQLSRTARLADAAWPYSIVLDGQTVGKITNRNSIKIQLAPGTHTLQILSLHKILSLLRLSSPTVTLNVSDEETADFTCHSRPFPQIIYWLIAALRGKRNGWIVLERAK
jgi:hypothetical protein